MRGVVHFVVQGAAIIAFAVLAGCATATPCRCGDGCKAGMSYSVGVMTPRVTK